MTNYILLSPFREGFGFLLSAVENVTYFSFHTNNIYGIVLMKLQINSENKNICYTKYMKIPSHKGTNTFFLQN